MNLLQKKILGALIIAVVAVASFVAIKSLYVKDEHSNKSPEEYHVAILMKKGDDFLPVVQGFKDGLAKIIGKNGPVNIVYRLALVEGEGQKAYDDVAHALVISNPDLIFAVAVNAVPAALNATAGTDIPVVYTLGGDPVALGYIDGMQDSKNNMTGVTWRAWELSGKRLEMMKRIKPSMEFALFITKKGGRSLDSTMASIQESAKRTNLTLIHKEVGTRGELEQILSDIDTKKIDGIFYATDPFFVDNVDLLIASSIKNKLPLVLHDSRHVRDGAIASYGADYYAAGNQVSKLAERIIVGKLLPHQIPSEGVTKLQLVLNQDAAKNMNIVFSDDILSIADDVYSKEGGGIH